MEEKKIIFSDTQVTVSKELVELLSLKISAKDYFGALRLLIASDYSLSEIRTIMAHFLDIPRSSTIVFNYYDSRFTDAEQEHLIDRIFQSAKAWKVLNEESDV